MLGHSVLGVNDCEELWQHDMTGGNLVNMMAMETTSVVDGFG